MDYYERIAEQMLPHVAGRPLVLQRFPDGIDGFGFYQKNTPDHVPDWIERVEIDTADGGSTRYPVVDDAAGIVYFANQGAIVFHTLLAKADAPMSPVEVIFDLDPSSDDLAPVRAAAEELRSVLEDLGLAPRVKSTGSRGLHVVVDVIDDGEVGFDLTSTFARRVAEIVSERGDFTLEFRKNQRAGRLFLDILRNGPASHAVAPYSLRPITGAPVAAPLDWDEALSADFHPRRHHDRQHLPPARAEDRPVGRTAATDVDHRRRPGPPRGHRLSVCRGGRLLLASGCRARIHVFAEPGHHGLLVVVAGCNADDQVHRLVSGDVEPMAVEGEKEGERLPGQSLVSVGQRVIASDANNEDRCLFDQRRIEVLGAEAGLGCVQRRVEQVDSRRSAQRVRIDPGDGLGDDQCLGERQVSHSAKRSRISLSRSTSTLRSPMNSSSLRTRSSSASRASRIS